jgi:hypothetical protein
MLYPDVQIAADFFFRAGTLVTLVESTPTTGFDNLRWIAGKEVFNRELHLPADEG